MSHRGYPAILAFALDPCNAQRKRVFDREGLRYHCLVASLGTLLFPPCECVADAGRYAVAGTAGTAGTIRTARTRRML